MTQFGVRPVTSNVRFFPRRPNVVVPIVLTPEGILNDACRRFGVTVAMIKGRGRRRPIVLARRHAAKRMYQELGLSSPHIGRILHKNHTSVLDMMKDGRANGRGYGYRLSRVA